MDNYFTQTKALMNGKIADEVHAGLKKEEYVGKGYTKAGSV